METINVPFDSVLKDTGEGGATLFLIDGEQLWVPNSIIEDIYIDSFDIPRWFAEKAELI